MNGHQTPSTSSLSNDGSGGGGVISENGATSFNLMDTIHGPVPEEDFEVPDFSLGISKACQMKIKTSAITGRACRIGLRRNLTCIVAGLFVREVNKKLQVLLVQEAKSSCRGTYVLSLM